MFKDFHTKTKEQIVSILTRFLEQEFFKAFPELKDQILVTITGSVAYDHYDKFSDLDFTIIFYEEEVLAAYKERLKEYKRNIILSMNLPLQMHGFHSLTALEKKAMNWTEDLLLKELSSAIVVWDSRQSYEIVRNKINHYPEDIWNDKIQWLYSEIANWMHEKLISAINREDTFFISVAKLHILTLIMTAYILLNRHYPVFAKHLSHEFFSLPEVDQKVKNEIHKLIDTKNLQEVSQSFEIIEKDLHKGLFQMANINRTTSEWLLFRSRYQVQTGII